MKLFSCKLLVASCLMLSTCDIPFVPLINAQEAAPEIIVPDNPNDPCAGLSQALIDCSFYKCTRPTGENADFTVIHAVEGLSPDGSLCKHYQNLPDGNILYCQYTEPMRYLVAKMSASEEPILNAYEEASISNAVNEECQVVTMEQMQQGGR